MNKFYVSWSGAGATYTRCFDSEEQRTYFIENYISTKEIKTWECE